MERRTAAAEDRGCANSSAVEAATAASKATAVKAASTAAAVTAATNLDRHVIGGDFRRRRRAGAGERQRLGALLRGGRENEYGRSRKAQTADKSASGFGNHHDRTSL
jgi:hypothetical protein